jgi:hypothetical protein
MTIKNYSASRSLCVCTRIVNNSLLLQLCAVAARSKNNNFEIMLAYTQIYTKVCLSCKLCCCYYR